MHWIVELARKKPGEVLFSLHHVIEHKWLGRRTRGKKFLWDKFQAFLARHTLPVARIVHRYASQNESLA
jgi:hypothetical protein